MPISCMDEPDLWVYDTFVSISSDTCDPDPCLNSGVCTTTTAGYSCSCAVGFSGSRCERGE